MGRGTRYSTFYCLQPTRVPVPGDSANNQSNTKIFRISLFADQDETARRRDANYH